MELKSSHEFNSLKKLIINFQIKTTMSRCTGYHVTTKHVIYECKKRVKTLVRTAFGNQGAAKSKKQEDLFVPVSWKGRRNDISPPP